MDTEFIAEDFELYEDEIALLNIIRNSEDPCAMIEKAFELIFQQLRDHIEETKHSSVDQLVAS